MRLKQLGRAIKNRRLELDMSLADLGRRTGLDPSTISRIENAQVSHPEEKTIRTLAQVLGLDVDECLIMAGYLPEGYNAIPPGAPSRGNELGPLTKEEIAILRKAAQILQEKFR